MDFLQRELHRHERSQTFQEKIVNYPEEKRRHVPTAASLHTKSEKVTYAGSTECDLCGRAHRTEQCWCITKLPLNERRDKARQAGLCFWCLSKGHIAKRSSRKCDKCQGAHHPLLWNNAHVPTVNDRSDNCYQC